MMLRLLPLLSALLLTPSGLLADILFTDITTAAGLNQSMSGEGVCVVDFDNDGLEDIFFAGFNNTNALYRNDGNMVFTEIAGSAGLEAISSTPSIVFSKNWAGFSANWNLTRFFL